MAELVCDALLAWFAEQQRDLPWRRDRDPYRVWVSEIMLQQTQVERVRGYFPRFLERFPDVVTLARADESAVLAAWEGLGYYRRARQMHAAAKQIVSRHRGCFPSTVTSLRSLPGVGRYTAAAVASIAFDHPEPIVEANSRRVIARLIGHAKPLAGTDADGPIWRAAESLVPSRHAGRYNQALMDLGAMVCTPVSPRCGVCPLARWCEAKRTGQANLIPVMAPRPRVVERREVALVVLRRRRLLLERRHEHEWWSGLWDFPRLSGARPRLVKQARDDHRHLGRFTYSVTRHHVRAEVLRIDGDDHLLVESGDPRRERRWVPIDHLDGIAMPAPARRIALRLVGTLPRKGRSTR